MSFFKNLFRKKETPKIAKNPMKSNEDFWVWFKRNELNFYHAVKGGDRIEKDFFDQLSPMLNLLRKDCFYFLSGMHDENTAELVLTAEGDIQNIPFVEVLIDSAPKLPHWKFTALKPASSIDETNIEMGAYRFNKELLSFYANEKPQTPDEIDITIIYRDFKEIDRELITNGSYIFLDNFLGELEFATTIDNVNVTGPEEAEKELVPVEKLKAFLTWREKEFVEKYQGLRYNTKDDSYSSMQATTKSNNPILATINRTLLEWDRKASHPWVCILEIKYDGSENNGLPSGEVYHLLNEIEDQLVDNELKDEDGYLNIGRQTTEGIRSIYFACKEFRKPSITLDKLTRNHDSAITISFDIFKDKYWQTFNRFMT